MYPIFLGNWIAGFRGFKLMEINIATAQVKLNQKFLRFTTWHWHPSDAIAASFKVFFWKNPHPG